MRSSPRYRVTVSLWMVLALLVSELAVAGGSQAASGMARVILSGRVYDGEFGTEPPQSTAMQGVTLVLYGSNSSGYLGDALDEATTDADGWYGLMVPSSPVKEFYTIVVTAPGGYVNEGCDSVGGECAGRDRIEYSYPLDGKILTGNKFWLKSRTPPTPTPTRSATPTRTEVPPTATATPTTVPPTATATRTSIPPTATASATKTTAPPTASATRTPTGTTVPATATRTASATATGVAPSPTASATRTPTGTHATPTPTATTAPGIIPRTFTGRVFFGPPGDRSHPLPGIRVVLARSHLRCGVGILLQVLATDLDGRFSIEFVTEAEDDQPYYTLAVDADEWYVRFAESASGAVYNSTRLQFEHPGSGLLEGNDFWVGALADVKSETFAATEDSYVDDGAPGSNYGSSSVLYTGWTTAGESRRTHALVRFDPYTLAQGTRVEKATLYLYLLYGSGEDPACLTVHEVTEEWCAGPLCGGIVPVTWSRHPGYDPYESAVSEVGTAAGYVSWDVTNLVQGWVDSPSDNDGLLVRGKEEGADWIRVFTSMESDHPPQLIVTVPVTTHLVTPTPTATVPPVTLDLSVQAVELTQGIQCLNNSQCADNKVPLVAGKMTAARVYVKVSGATSVSGVSASAVATVNGKKYTAWAINTSITAKASPDRGKFNDTLNFYLYGVQASGTLEVEVNPFGTIQENDYSNNKKTVNLKFVTVPNIKIVPIWIYITTSSAKEIVDWSMPGYLEGYSERLFPVAGIDWYLLSSPVVTWTETLLDTGDSWGRLLDKVADRRNKSTSVPSDAYWYGMIPFGYPVGAMAGLSQGSPLKCAIGRTPKTHENLEDGADILVHELGHNLGRGHVNCGLPAGASYDTSYPYNAQTIGDYGWDWGVAAGGKKSSSSTDYVVPISDADIMSYCQDEWISEYTYQGMMTRMGTTAASVEPAASASEARPYLFTAGAIVDGVAVLAPFSILDRPAGSNDAPGEGPYRLRLVSGSQAILFERRFEAQEAIPSYLAGKEQPTGPTRLSFYQILPWHPETARIELWREEQLLGVREVSAHWPQVQMLGPPGGSFWPAGGEYPVNWAASDPDGNPLWFDVAYSRDGGETWEVFATGLTEPQVMVASNQLAGSEQAMFRVYATDGVRTADATSGPLVIERKPPLVLIGMPEEGQVIPPGAPVGFSGMALDWEDSGHADLALHWSSSRDGWLGDGREVMVPELSAGWHDVTLHATDSDGMSGVARVRVLVEARVYLPVVVRGR